MSAEQGSIFTEKVLVQTTNDGIRILMESPDGDPGKVAEVTVTGVSNAGPHAFLVELDFDQNGAAKVVAVYVDGAAQTLNVIQNQTWTAAPTAQPIYWGDLSGPEVVGISIHGRHFDPFLRGALQTYWMGEVGL